RPTRGRRSPSWYRTRLTRRRARGRARAGGRVEGGRCQGGGRRPRGGGGAGEGAAGPGGRGGGGAGGAGGGRGLGGGGGAGHGRGSHSAIPRGGSSRAWPRGGVERERCAPPWEGLERLLRHATAEWERRPRHRDPIFERDGWRCAVPACTARASLRDHHVIYRSHGGDNARDNRVAICAAHHLNGIHRLR